MPSPAATNPNPAKAEAPPTNNGSGEGTTAAEHALAAMRSTVFGADPMAQAPPIEPMIQAPNDPEAPLNASPGADPNELSDFIEISGLLRYDPAAITRIYAGHPQRLARRLWQTLVPMGLYLSLIHI